jgi:hypothetical protein
VSKGPQTFRQSDVTKALKAAVAAKVDLARVEIGPDGKIVMIMKRPGSDKPEEGGEWGNI